MMQVRTDQGRVMEQSTREIERMEIGFPKVRDDVFIATTPAVPMLHSVPDHVEMLWIRHCDLIPVVRRSVRGGPMRPFPPCRQAIQLRWHLTGSRRSVA